MKRVLILCTENSARSQMAEGLVNAMRGDRWKAFSAGVRPSGHVHPDAITALKEVGIDMPPGTRSKSVDEFQNILFDLVITVCDEASEECPIWLGQGKRVHVGFPDPAQGSLDDFRTVRDQIKARIIPLLDSLEAESVDGDSVPGSDKTSTPF